MNTCKKLTLYTFHFSIARKRNISVTIRDSSHKIVMKVLNRLQYQQVVEMVTVIIVVGESNRVYNCL